MYPVVAMPSLKELRERASMSQAELADLVGVRYQLVSDWERGVYTPRPSNVRKLCRALSCKREELEFSNPNPSSFITCDGDLPLEVVVSMQQERIIELQQMLDGSFEHINSQQEYIDKLTALLKTHGLDHYIKRL